MRFWFLLALITSSFLLSACSSRRGADQQDRELKNEGLKNEDLASGSSERLNQFYFTELNIVAETEAGTNCKDDQKLVGVEHNRIRVSLNPEKRLTTHWKDLYREFVVNVRLQLIGFDEARYEFTAPDGRRPRSIPVEMYFVKRPNHHLDIYYLDQKISLPFNESPIFSFSANEVRGECKIIHHVNLYAENTGYYPEAESSQ